MCFGNIFQACVFSKDLELLKNRDRRYIGIFHLVRMQFFNPIGTTSPLFARNMKWECIGDVTPPPLGAYILNGRPHRQHWDVWYCNTHGECREDHNLSLVLSDYLDLRAIRIDMNEALHQEWQAWRPRGTNEPHNTI